MWHESTLYAPVDELQSFKKAGAFLGRSLSEQAGKIIENVT